jgi:PAS domain S-box-containing protein
MRDKDKTKKYLISELEKMRHRSARLEILEATHRRAMTALRESERRYSTLFEKTVNPILVNDIEGYYVDCNEAALQFLECTREELLEKNARDFVRPDMESEVLKTDIPLWDSNGTVKTEYCINGKVKVLELAVTPVMWQGRRVVFGLGKDITERKRAEKALKQYSERLEEMVEERTRELREAHEKLVRTEKLATLGQLAGGVGHELRNPLGVIKNAAYLLNMILEDTEPEVKEALDILGKEVATSDRIISSLLDFARAKPPTRREVDINEVVRETLSRIAVPENIEVATQLKEALPSILADPDQLVQVFGNAITNAGQAMPEGGRIVVKSEAPSVGWVSVSFTDTGVGIPEENLNKIFEPLFTSKAKGIGLGLAIIKTMVEAHGGDIEVQSEVGRGSTFTVRLPIGEEEEK